ncbi:hypothetical protein OHO28_20040 [Streptomyces europaeiscabiei]|uniref:hypothetical protein n=1 Tax=Streptomyces europaeiscabiei TaxID=146819 RepID=UPI002E17F642
MQRTSPRTLHECHAHLRQLIGDRGIGDRGIADRGIAGQARPGRRGRASWDRLRVPRV